MMRRKDFLSATVGGALAGAFVPGPLQGMDAGTDGKHSTGVSGGSAQDAAARAAFPRLENDVFVNGAGGTPLGRFADESIEAYLQMMRLGRGDGRGAWWADVYGGVRGRFASLIGAREEEIGLVECTKAGEQIVLDGLPSLREGGNIVTNDLHFSGSLHNLEGLRRSGTDVLVVRHEDWVVDPARMIDAIDDRTSLVTVSLVSNINGHVESVAAIAAAAHAHGALVFADVIQAAGVVPFDVHELGIDVAACSSYKWLFGLHGAGFLFVSEALQGHVLEDHLYPGRARRTYAPFAPDGEPGSIAWTAPADARRYQPGHVSYLGYAAVDAGLRFIEEYGVPELLEHSVRLNQHLVDQLDPNRYRVLSPHLDESPILGLEAVDFDGTLARLKASDVVISAGGDKHDLLRISPAVYNTEADMDRVAEVLNAEA
jgi:selenocysteine lyase/cysteine desulfurase